MEEKIKEESRGGGQVRWKELSSEANEGLQDCENWPNELPSAKHSSFRCKRNNVQGFIDTK